MLCARAPYDSRTFTSYRLIHLRYDSFTNTHTAIGKCDRQLTRSPTYVYTNMSESIAGTYNLHLPHPHMNDRRCYVHPNHSRRRRLMIYVDLVTAYVGDLRSRQVDRFGCDRYQRKRSLPLMNSYLGIASIHS
jgi:hypothetical protein